MRYDIRQEGQFINDLLEIYGDMETADAAISGALWALARAPLHRETWPVAVDSEIRLTPVKPYRHFPAIAMSYSIIIDETSQHCLMHRARRVNAGGTA